MRLFVEGGFRSGLVNKAELRCRNASGTTNRLSFEVHSLPTNVCVSP